MNRQHAVPCADCQKAFHGAQELAYLYCGHHRVILFRGRSGPVELVPVRTTDEAIRIIQQRSGAGSTLARTA